MPAALGLNVFRGDAFSNLSLTRMVNKVPYLPMTLGSMNLFDPIPLLTDSAAIDRLQNAFGLILTSPRGAPPSIRADEKRTSTLVKVPRLAQKTKVRADEILNIRSYDEPLQLMTLQELVARRLTGPTGIRKQIEYTWENHRLGAVQGMLLDADGSTIMNFFTTFGVTPPTPFNFDLTQLTTPGMVDGYVRKMINTIIRTVKRASQGAFIDNVSQVVGLCGDNFWDLFVNHPDVIETYKFYYGAASIREEKAFGTLQFGGIQWINYRGSDDATTIAVPTNQCAFFPKNAPGVFEVYYAPGETFEDVSKPGEPFYVYNLPDPTGKNAFQEFEINSFPLHICVRPETLQVGIASAGELVGTE
jgi:hypothetical protein